LANSNSRYAKTGTLQITVPDGAGGKREIVYQSRRFIPPAGSAGQLLVEHTMLDGERLDGIAARYLGDPSQYWRICDSNAAVDPSELEEPGRVIVIRLTVS
jgi:hypothetical protein